MTGKIIIICLILLLIIPITTSQGKSLSCETANLPGLCIDVQFKTTTEGWSGDSKYEFPDLVKINDYLIIDKLTVVFNQPSNEKHNTTKQFDYRLDIYPLSFDIPDEYKEDRGLYEIRIPAFIESTKYEAIHTGNGEYEFKLNDQFIDTGTLSINPVNLFRHGDWVINETLIGEKGYSTFFNGEWKNKFFIVLSRTEIANIETAEATRKNLKLSWLYVIVPILVMLFIAKITVKKMDEQSKILDEVADNITDASKDQINRMEKFEEDKRKNIIKNLIYELKDNREFAKTINDKCKERSTYIPEYELYLTSSLIKVTTDLIVQDAKLNKELMHILMRTEKINESIKRLQEMDINTFKKAKYDQYISDSAQLEVRLGRVISKLEEIL